MDTCSRVGRDDMTITRARVCIHVCERKSVLKIFLKSLYGDMTALDQEICVCVRTYPSYSFKHCSNDRIFKLETVRQPLVFGWSVGWLVG